jgi:hypothetical protein
MKKQLSLALFASALGLASLPAVADCVSSAQAVESDISKLSNQAKKEKAQRSISLAVESAQNGDEAACEKHFKEAKRIAGIRGETVSSR